VCACVRVCAVCVLALTSPHWLYQERPSRSNSTINGPDLPIAQKPQTENGESLPCLTCSKAATIMCCAKPRPRIAARCTAKRRSFITCTRCRDIIWMDDHTLDPSGESMSDNVMHHRAASSDGLSSVVPSRANVLLHTNNCYAFSQSLHCKYQGPYVSSKIWRLMCKMESESATSCDATPCCSLPWAHVCIHAPCVVPPPRQQKHPPSTSWAEHSAS
jgi:hypothetical protein